MNGKILEIAKKISSIGGKMYLVGGAVRDAIMGRPVHDEDYCVVGISFEEFVQMFPDANIRGKDFPVFDMNGCEIALARIERKVAVGHKGFEIKTDKNITIKQDLKRRDITINAIAQDVLTCEIIDPFNGREDIKNQIIRATSESFKEDPLRVYRVARFASMLDFIVEPNTIKMMNELKNELATISKERVFEEFRKVLKTDKPSKFFNTLRKADVLQTHFKEIYDLIGAEQPEKYHPEGDSYNHTMEVIDRACAMTENLEIRYAALVHDLGKGITPKEMYPHHYGHDKNGVEVVGKFNNRIGVPNSWKKCAKISAKEHMLGGIFWQMTPAKQVDFLERVNKSMLGLEGLQIVVNADKNGRDVEPFTTLKKPILDDINGEYVKKKYGLSEGIQLKEKLREERISVIKRGRF